MAPKIKIQIQTFRQSKGRCRKSACFHHGSFYWICSCSKSTGVRQTLEVETKNRTEPACASRESIPICVIHTENFLNKRTTSGGTLLLPFQSLATEMTISCTCTIFFLLNFFTSCVIIKTSRIHNSLSS